MTCVRPSCRHTPVTGGSPTHTARARRGREKVVRIGKPKAQIESRVNLSGLNTNARYRHSPVSK
ncbi:hypothetical protein J6590_023347 [Homalodisca vitripennis]|nr:hypothetical protein J6590_023347 [Homalodisca vitripennis]